VATLAALPLIGHPAYAAESTDVEFDREALKRRGFDPALADLFRRAPRFLPGALDVAFEVNGRPRGRARAVFNAEGELRFDAALLQALHLHVPGSISTLPAGTDFTLQQAWPQAIVRLQPALQRVALVVPAEAIDDSAPALDSSAFQGGGSAALLNYDLSASQTRGYGQRRETFSAFTETGFNTAGWMVRSHQTFNTDAGRGRLRNVDAYAQHRLGRTRLLQVGDIQVMNPLLPAGFIRGVQVLPDTALQASTPATRALVEGVAASEARVEIRQNGVLLYSTLVPPGPFALGGFALNSAAADLEVSVQEAEGTRRFLVSAVGFQHASMSAPGSSIALGQRRTLGSREHADAEMLLAASTAFRVPGADAVISAGSLLSERYQSAGLGLDQALHGPFDAVLSVRGVGALVSPDQHPGKRRRGSRIELRLSGSVGNASANIGISRRTAGFLDIDELPLEAGVVDRRVRWQAALGAGWNSPLLGAFRLTHQPRLDFAGERSSRSLVSWSRRLGSGDLRASVELNHGARTGFAQDPKTVYVSWSMPLGPGYTRVNLRSRSSTMQRTLSVGAPLGRDGTWRASVDSSSDQPGSRLAAGMDTGLHAGRFSANVTYGGGYRSLGAQFSGGVVAHADGLTFSSQRVQDTFGVVQVGDVPGVRVSTDGGDVWTDRHGRAVLARVAPYRNSRVQVDTRTIPRDLDLASGVAVLQMQRGSVGRVAFAAQRSRRLLLRATDAAGQPLAKGLSVLAAGNFLTVVVDSGRVYLSDYQPDIPLQVHLPDGTRCTLRPQLDAQHASADAFLEEGKAQCVP